MCWLETMEECDVEMEDNGGFFQQTIHFSVPYATTKIRLDDFDGAKEIAFSVQLIGFNNDKRLNIFNPMQGGFATTSIVKIFLAPIEALENQIISCLSVWLKFVKRRENM